MTLYHTSEENKTPITVHINKDYEPMILMPAPTEELPQHNFDLFANQKLTGLPKKLVEKTTTKPFLTPNIYRRLIYFRTLKTSFVTSKISPSLTNFSNITPISISSK